MISEPTSASLGSFRRPTPDATSDIAYSIQKYVQNRLDHSRQTVIIAAQHPIGRHLVQRPEQEFRNHLRVELPSENLEPLPLLNDLPQHLQILSQIGRRKMLHEFGRLTQLDLKDNGDVLLLFEQRKMEMRKPTQLLAWVF